MIPPKITLNDGLRAFILDERKRTGKAAEIVSAEIGKSKSWLAQLENGRTKSISRSDFIKLISFLREEEDLAKIEAFIQATTVAIDRKLPMPSSPDDDKVRLFVDNNDYSAEGIDKSIQDWIKAMNFFISNVYERYPDKKAIEDILYNFLYSLQLNPGLVLSIMGSPLNRLQHISSSNRQKFFDEFYKLIDKYGQDDDFDLFVLNTFKK